MSIRLVEFYHNPLRKVQIFFWNKTPPPIVEIEGVEHVKTFAKRFQFTG